MNKTEALNEKALAAQAWADLEVSADATGELEVARVSLPIDKVRALVAERRAALSSSPVSGLVERLRRVDHGSVEDCFLQSPLFEKAATALTDLEAENARLKAEVERLRELASELPIVKYALRATEARLAEALKAIDRILVPFEGGKCRRDHHGYCQTHFLEKDCCVDAARRVREGGKVE